MLLAFFHRNQICTTSHPQNKMHIVWQETEGYSTRQRGAWFIYPVPLSRAPHFLFRATRFTGADPEQVTVYSWVSKDEDFFSFTQYERKNGFCFLPHLCRRDFPHVARETYGKAKINFRCNDHFRLPFSRMLHSSLFIVAHLNHFWSSFTPITNRCLIASAFVSFIPIVKPLHLLQLSTRERSLSKRQKKKKKKKSEDCKPESTKVHWLEK